ncbi:hypothetical protein OC845_003471 [Tilletia horrida]|nr:hypothetical protein OC845_003471 [Tilletia horrida]
MLKDTAHKAAAVAAEATSAATSSPLRRASAAAQRRASRSSSSNFTADSSSNSMGFDEIESVLAADEKEVPFAPPSLDYDAYQAEIDQHRAAAAADSAFGGWHWAPLVIALAPPIGTLLGGHADAWSDAILLLLGTFWLYQWMRVPWDMYALSRTRRILQADEEEEEDEADEEMSEQERQARHRARLYSLTELQRTEFLSLLGCMSSPFIGALFLTWAQDNMTDGHKYLNAFNIRLFTLAAGIRPWMHGISLLRRRLILLQEDVHYPSSRVESLKRKVNRLDSDLSTLRKLVATKSDVTILREGIDLPLSQLSRAVRRNEKKEEHLRLSAEDKFSLVEARLDDLLREVAINADLIEEERRERERLAQMPFLHFVQAVRLMVGSGRNNYPGANMHARAIGPGPSSRSVPQIQGGSGMVNGSSSRHASHHGPNGTSNGSRSHFHPHDSYGHYLASSYPTGSGARSPASETNEPAWYAKGPFYYVFFPLNLSNAALTYAHSKVSSLLEDASPPPPSSYHYQATSPSGNYTSSPPQMYAGLTPSSSKTRLGKKKQIKT